MYMIKSNSLYRSYFSITLYIYIYIWWKSNSVYIYVCVCVCMCVSVYMCMCVCVYMCVYVYIYIFILCFIFLDRLDFHMIDNLSVAFQAFARHMLTSLSVDEMLPPTYVNSSTNFRGLSLRVEVAPFCYENSRNWYESFNFYVCGSLMFK